MGGERVDTLCRRAESEKGTPKGASDEAEFATVANAREEGFELRHDVGEVGLDRARTDVLR